MRRAKRCSNEGCTNQAIRDEVYCRHSMKVKLRISSTISRVAANIATRRSMHEARLEGEGEKIVF